MGQARLRGTPAQRLAEAKTRPTTAQISARALRGLTAIREKVRRDVPLASLHTLTALTRTTTGKLVPKTEKAQTLVGYRRDSRAPFVTVDSRRRPIFFDGTKVRRIDKMPDGQVKTTLLARVPAN